MLDNRSRPKTDQRNDGNLWIRIWGEEHCLSFHVSQYGTSYGGRSRTLPISQHSRLLYFWYGWTSPPPHRGGGILPSIGLSIIGSGSMVVMQAVMVYVTIVYAKYAASASAAICFGGNLFAAFPPLAAMPMYTELRFR